jgi:RNA polymerase sigma-70 factor (ECF subfamily)
MFCPFLALAGGYWMNNADDEVLLRAFAEKRSEDAFLLLVERYAGLVFGVAVRRNTVRELAEEATQNAFVVLARKAHRLSGAGSLAPWLHRVAFFEATKLQRAETRRQIRMNKLLEESALGSDGPDPWEEVSPLLDEAIEHLAETERRVLLLHYFEGLVFREVARRLDLSA